MLDVAESSGELKVERRKKGILFGWKNNHPDVCFYTHNKHFNVYGLESHNHTLNPTDPGTIWFSDSNAEHYIFRYLSSLNLSLSETTFLDLGTGNGHLLFSLIEDGGFDGKLMLGVDYSEGSVELAKAVGKDLEEKDEEDEERVEGAGEVVFKRADVVRDDGVEILQIAREFRKNIARNRRIDNDEGNNKDEKTEIKGNDQNIEESEGFDIVLDKGTFDAISLSSDMINDKRADEVYVDNVEEFIKEETGILLVTSCNWTEEELKRKMTKDGKGSLEVCGRIEYKSFMFGGKKGQTVSSVAFKRRKNNK